MLPSGKLLHGQPDVVNVIADYDLKLSAAFNDHDNARIGLQRFGVSFTAVVKLKAQARRAMNEAFYIFLSTNVAENIVSQFLIFHR